jgi:putative FmdB family regulatory protein
MPIYEYRCEVCGKISEFLFIKTDETFIPQCKRCKSKKMSRVLSKVRVIRSEESRMESLADPSKWSDLDGRDPKSMAKWMKRMGKEMGEDMEGMDEELDKAVEEEINAKSKGEPEE